MLSDEISESDSDCDLDLNNCVEKMEVKLIRKALVRSNWKKTDAAQLLGIPRSTMYYKMKLYDIKEYTIT